MKSFVLRLFYIVFAATVIFVMAVAFCHPQNNLFPGRMTLGVGVSIILFLTVCFLWKRFWKASSTGAYWGLLTLGIVILFGICLLRGNVRWTLADYTYVYNSAMELVEEGKLSYPKYFWNYSNNVAPLLMLAGFFRFAKALGIDEFYVLLVVSVVTWGGAVWAAGSLLAGEAKIRWRIPYLLFFLICLPIYVFTGSFYTDTMSLGGIMILALFLKKGRGSVAYLMAAAILTVYFGSWKATALIPLIAMVCTVFLYFRKENVRKLAVFLVILILCTGLASVGANRFSIYREAQEKGNPVTGWIALGMGGDGSWGENHEFVMELNELETKAEKRTFISRHIREMLGEALSRDHIIRKAQRTFAGGTLGSKDFVPEEDDGTLLWDLMNPWGRYYWYSSEYTFCYIGLIYGVYLIGSVLALWDLFHHLEISPLKYLFDLSFFGFFVFMMLWEANNRQLYNQMPTLLAGLFVNADYILQKIPRGKSDLAKHQETRYDL